MRFATPDGLDPTWLAFSDSGQVWALAHPRGDGPVNADVTVLFRIEGAQGVPVRVFDFEITAITALGEDVLVVDEEADSHLLRAGAWTEFPEGEDYVSRLTVLATIEGAAYGLGFDGLVYRWTGSGWAALTDEEEDIDLYDVTRAPDGTLVFAGCDGFVGRISGRGFDRIALPTDVDINGIVALPDGRLVLAGDRGTVFVLDGDEAVLVDLGDLAINFADCVLWQGRVLLPADEAIIELVDGTTPRTFFTGPALRLQTDGTQLWRLWEGGLARHQADGTWTEIALAADL